MKKLLCVCAALAMTLSAASVLAADVTGTWTSQMNTQDGNSMSLTFNFKQDGATLTGSIQTPEGGGIDISNGKIDGDKISFEVSFNGMTITHSGTVDGDVIKLTSKSDSGDFPGMELTLTRAKAMPAAPPPPLATPAKPQ